MSWLPAWPKTSELPRVAGVTVVEMLSSPNRDPPLGQVSGFILSPPTDGIKGQEMEFFYVTLTGPPQENGNTLSGGVRAFLPNHTPVWRLPLLRSLKPPEEGENNVSRPDLPHLRGYRFSHRQLIPAYLLGSP